MALTAGSIAFTGFNGDGNDNLSFAVLTDIPQGTVINFTDSNWNGSGFSKIESVFTWTAGSAIAAGTVIDINNIKAGNSSTAANTGTIAWTNTTNPGLSNDSEVVYAYVGTPGPTTFLAAISNVGYGTNEGTLTGTGLVAGQTAVSFTGALDIMGYNGVRSGQADYASYLTLINNPANWLTQDGGGDQNADGTAPEAPFPATAFTVTASPGQSVSFSPANVSIDEGDGGTKVMTFTVTRAGGTTGAVSFSGTFSAGTTNAADFGGALPASTFSGTIADGASSATVTITIAGDTTLEADESFTLTLISATNSSASVTIGTATATGTIGNDDAGTLIDSNTSSISFGNGDHVLVLSGVTVSGSNAATWTGGGPAGETLDNFGNISGSSRGLATGSSGGNLTVHNEAGGTIQAVKDAVKVSNLGGSVTGSVTINNDGTIKSTGTGDNTGQALDLDDIASSNAHSVINNSATGLIQAADADAIRGGTNATINNHGRIIGGGGDDGIDFQMVNTGGVVNNFADGAITGGRHGITGDQPITVTNAGTITGQAGSGINMDSGADTTTTVTNSGTITGTSVNGADADGIDVDGLVAIENSGTIKAVGLTTGGSLNEALAIGGGSVHNAVGGLIVSDQRAITVDDSNHGSAFSAITIINEGTIDGGNGEAISIVGTFADTIINKGMIVGSVDMGGGDDVFNDYAGSSLSGRLDGGDGNDTVNLEGTGEGALGAMIGVETVHVTAGVWTIGADSAAEIDLDASITTIRFAASTTTDGDVDGVIKGLGEGDVIDLQGVGTSTAATLGANNLLTVVGGANGPITIQLDPTQDFTDLNFKLADDHAGGTTITLEKPMGPGSIAFTGFNADGNDNLSFVVLQDIAAGTVINFTDNEWTGTAFNTGENNWTWTASSDIAAGTVVTMDSLATQTPTSNLGAIAYSTTATRDISIGNESVFAYVGSSSQPTFLAAISNNTFSSANVVGVLTNTGLVEGQTAINLATVHANSDIAVYNGPHGAFSYSDFLSAINNATNWAYQDTAANDSNDGVAPDVPFSTTPFTVDPTAQVLGFASDSVTVSHSEGNSGTTTTYTFTIQRTNGTTGEVNFSGKLTPGTGVDAADFGGTLPTTFSGTIADGAATATVTVTVAGDNTYENNETFGLTLTSTTNTEHAVFVGGQTTATGTIVNDEPSQTITFSADSISVTHDEGAAGTTTTTYTFTVVRDGTSGNLTYTAQFFGNASSTPADFGGTLPTTITGVIPDGQTSGTFSVTVTGDDMVEGDHNFVVQLNGGTNDAGITVFKGASNQTSAKGYILNDDFVVHNGQNVDESVALADNDHFTVENGGTMTLYHATLTGADFDVVIDNDGTLRYGNSGGAITVSTGSSGTLTFNNHSDGQTSGSLFTPSTFTDTNVSLVINNDGAIDGAGATIALGSTNVTAVLNNSSTGVITSYAGNKAYGITAWSNATINNAGQIIGSQDAITGGGVIHNEAGGLIQGARHGITGNGPVTVINDAGATIMGPGGSALNIDNSSDPAKTVHVTNHGVMEGGQTGGGGDGDGVDVDGLLVLDNDGRIAGLSAYGYHDNEPNVSEGVAMGGGTINNYAGGEIYGYGRAIQVDNSSNGNAYTATTITNAGLIQGDGHLPEGVTPEEVAEFAARIQGAEAINIVDTFDDTVTNEATGQIVGGVSMGGGDDILTNAGSITATGGNAVTMGDGADTLTNSSTITGNVDLGAGDDIINLSTGSSITGTLDGGAGNDTLNLEGTGTGSIGAIVGVEIVHVDGGDWTLDSDSASEIDFGTGQQTMRFTSAATADGDVDGVIKGFAKGDTIDLQGIGAATAATLGANNVLTITGGTNGPITIQLDPNQSFADKVFAVADDGAGGTLVTETNAPQQVSFATTSRSVTQVEGDSGPQTVTFTVQRTGGTAGDLHFSIAISQSSGLLNADDFGGTMPGTIEGVILDGETTATFTLTYTGDTRYEATDIATVQLVAASNDQAAATVARTGYFANLSITNDDAVPTGVAAGEIIEGPITLTGNTTFVVEAGGIIHTGMAVPITWSGPNSNAVIENSGTIESDTGSGISVASSARGTLVINNHVGGQLLSGVDMNGQPTGSTVTINNEGLITDDVSATLRLSKSTAAGAVINNLATGVITAANAHSSVLKNGGNVTVNNWGKIILPADTAETSGGDAIDFDKSVNNTVHNYAGGLIEGSHHAITGSRGITVINDAGGTIVGRNGSAVNMDNDASVANTAIVMNHGTMLGESTNSEDSDGDAIDVDGLAQIDNYGAIKGLGANGTHDGGANVSEGVAIGGGVINNYAGGEIYGYGRAIEVDDSAQGPALGATTIYNEGLIQGDGHGPQNFEAGSDVGIVLENREAIDILGTFADKITNKGQIVGGVFTDGGDDTFIAYAGSTVTGLIDGGSGNDTLELIGPGTGKLGANTGFETLDVQSGVWIVDSADYQTIHIAGDATVTSRLSLADHGALTVDVDGSLVVAGTALEAAGPATVENSGSIGGFGQPDADGIVVNGGTIHNHASGIILGQNHAIEAGAGAAAGLTIVNDGLIQGFGGTAIALGAQNDTLTNNAMILGGVDLGDGDDTLVILAGSSISGAVTGGEGSDTVTLVGTTPATVNNFDTASVSSFEKLVVQSGEWALAVSGTNEPQQISYDEITVKDGATLSSASPGQLVVTGNDHLTIEAGGTVSGTDTAILWTGLDSDVTITNAGTIEADTFVLQIDPNVTGGKFTLDNQAGGEIHGAFNIVNPQTGSTILINNAGLMTADGSTVVSLGGSLVPASVTFNNLAGGVVTADASSDLIKGGINFTLNNAGAIQSQADTATVRGGDAVTLGLNGDVVHNLAGGLIEGSHHAVTGTRGATIINDEGATMIGRNGSAVNIDNDKLTKGTVNVTNHGTMLGESAGYTDSDGDAIDADGLANIDNWGQIKGLGANGTHDGGANVSEGIAIGGGVINNYAGATIYGYGRAIQVDNSSNGAALAATTIYNEGTIQGGGNGPQNFEEGSDAGIVIAGREAIDILGTFADTITNKGQIVGGVFTDGGDDVFNAYAGSTVSGKIDLGDGNDTINLFANPNSSATGVLGAIASIENLNVESGTWSLSSITGVSDIDIADGATVTSAMKLTGDQHLTIEHGGTLQGAVTLGNAGVLPSLDNSGTIILTSGNAVGVGASTTGDLTVLNNAGGLIQSSGNAIRINGNLNGSTFTLVNAGTLNSTGNHAVRLDATNGHFVVENLAGGLIQTVAADDALRLDGNNMTVSNAGTILVGPDPVLGNKGGDAVDFQSGTGDSLHNLAGGYIEGSRHAATGDKGATIVNDAGGTMIGRNGSAVNIDNDATVANMVHVTNYGDMEGRSANYSDSDGDAIDVDGLLQLDNYGTVQGLGANGYHDGTSAIDANISEGVAIGAGTIHNYAGAMIYGYGRAIQVDDSSNGPALASTIITNDGTIQGDGHGPTGVADADAAFMQAKINGAEAIDIIGTFADIITNTATGQIIGGIFTDGGDDILSNAGTITAKAGAAINMGDGNDTVTNTGTITGNVVLGAGDDVFNAYIGSTVTGSIDGGDGNDTVNLLGTGTGSFGTAVNAEKLNVVGGTWSVADSQNYAAIDVKDGAVLAGSVTLARAETLTVEAGGAVGSATAGANIYLEVIQDPQTSADVPVVGATLDNAGTIYGFISGYTGFGGGGHLSIINEASGQIFGGYDASRIINISGVVDSTGVLIDNAGLIDATTALPQGVIATDNASGGPVSIVNRATGEMTALAGQTVLKLGSTTTVNNAGTIKSGPDDQDEVSGGDAIAFKGNAAGGRVINVAGGLIEGSHHAVSAKAGIVVTNDGIMIGRNGSAVNVDNDATVGNTVFVTNHGEMHGKSAGYTDSDGDAIDTDGLAQIDNWGLISGEGANGYHDGTTANDANVSEGIAIGGGTIHNYAGATIYGYGRAIQVDNSSNGPAFASTTIINEGLIQGDGHGPTGVDPADAVTAQAKIAGREAIDILGTFADTITNKGQIIGGVFTDGGDDVFNAYVGSTVSGTIDLGAGSNDTVHLLATAGSNATGSLGTVTNAEYLKVDSGIWTVSAAQNFFSVEVAAGATIASTITLTHDELLNVKQGGLIQGAKNAIIVSNGNSGTIITNDGTIKVTNAAGTKSDAISISSGTAQVVNNSHGVIEGGRHAITGPGAITVINNVGGLIVGHNGSAVNMDNDADPANAADILNYGTMLGDSATTSDSDGDAIDVDGLATITNYGSIRGEGHNGYHGGVGADFANVSEGIAIGGGVINNYVGATIYGYGRAIEVDDSNNGAALGATVIFNQGLIQGDGHAPTGVSDADAAAMLAKITGREAIDILGAFDDTITNMGQIKGGVFTDGGNDAFNAYVGSSVTGTIDLGDGTDTVSLLGFGNGTFGTAINAEKLAVIQGSWSVANTANYSDITVYNATLTSQVVLSGSDKLTVNAGGTISGSVPVLWNGGSTTTIDNAGHITATSRGIDTGSTVSGDLNIVNQEGGSIIATADAIRIQSLNGTATGKVTIDNAGTIRALTGGEAFDLKKSTSVNASFEITNEATGVIESQSSEAIVFGHHTTLYNYGQILATEDTLAQSGVDTDQFSDAQIFNYAGALISGGHHGITGNASATIVNDGEIIGNNGSGINLDTSSSSITTVTNTGTIIGTALRGDGDAIDVDGQLALTNSGTIKSLLTFEGETNEALAIGGGTIHNLASGVIYSDQRAIEVDNSNAGNAFAAVTIVNDGTIQGADGEAIRIIGSFADSITNHGAIIGSVSMGGGGDMLVNTDSIVVASGIAVDMGDGNDTVILGTGSVVTGTIVLGAGDDTLTAADNAVVVDGGAGSDHVVGGAMADSIDGGADDDTLIGGGGADTLTGGTGNDLLEGDQGNDTLIGGDGSDIYRYANGDGSDLIIEGAGQAGDSDTLMLANADFADATLYKHGDDLRVVLQDGSVITVQAQFADGGVENIVFGDGSLLDRNGIVTNLLDNAPVASDVVLPTLAEDAPAFVVSFADLLAAANASDADLDVLTVSAVGSFVGGTAEMVDGGIKFTLDANYNGTASFSFTVDDGRGGTVQANASFDVTPVNDAPIVVTPDAVTLNEDTPAHGQIVASDVDGDALTYTIKGDGAAHGTLTIDEHGAWSYTPATNYNGGDSFTVVVDDGHTTTESTVSLTINPVNDLPQTVADAATVGENETASFNLIGNDIDVEDGKPTLTGFHVTGVDGIALDNDTAASAFSIVNGQLQFNPGSLFDGLNDGQHATVTISYTAEDSDHGQATGEFVLTINGETDFNVITGTDQSDLLMGTGGADQINGGDGNDTLYTGDGDDVVDAGSGNDFVFAGNGVKTIDGGDGNDYLFGGAGDSTINGGNGNDVIMGGSGNETLKGGAGNDLIYAGSGNDTLVGGEGNDLLYGGAGSNTFVFAQNDGHDTVMSFQASGTSHDIIQIDVHEFADYAALAQSSAFTDTAEGAKIAYHDGSAMTFTGIHKADLTVDDFRFA